MQWKESRGIKCRSYFYGENGSLAIDGDNYQVHDLDNKLKKEVKSKYVVNPLNLSDPAEDLDALHLQNFISGIKSGTPLIADIPGGHKSTLLCQLGNIALRSGNTLNIDSSNGHIKNDDIAGKFWKRDYQPGWEPTI